MADDHRALDTRVDVMTEEAGADPTLGYTRETEVQVAQDTPAQTDMPAGTETQDGDTCLTTTEPRAVHPTDSDRAITDHRLCTPGTTLGVDHPHTTTKNHIDVASPYKITQPILTIKITTTHIITSMKI